jgi:hypothetical protein
MASLTNTVVYNTKTDSATHTQADGAFVIQTNYALGSHQVHAYTDVTASAGTMTVEYEVADGVYLPVLDSGTPVSITLSAPVAFDTNLHTASLRFTPDSFDAGKFIGVRVYSKNIVA